MHKISIITYYVQECLGEWQYTWERNSCKETNKNGDKEASPAELHSTRKLNVYETSQEQNQLTKLQMLPAEPFTFMGNIWNEEEKNHLTGATL